jgi:hypothetical protein
MIQAIVFVSYWPLLAYDVHRLAFPAAFFKNQRISVESPLREAIMLEFERSRSRPIELRATAPSVFFPGLVQVLSARKDEQLAAAALHEPNASRRQVKTRLDSERGKYIV